MTFTKTPLEFVCFGHYDLFFFFLMTCKNCQWKHNFSIIEVKYQEDKNIKTNHPGRKKIGTLTAP